MIAVRVMWRGMMMCSKCVDIQFVTTCARDTTPCYLLRFLLLSMEPAVKPGCAASIGML